MRPALPVLVCVYVPLGVLLVAVKLAAPGEHASALIEPEFSPAASLTRGSLWIAGLVGWAWAVAACFIGVLATRKHAALAAPRRLLAGAGLLTVIMFVDDLFQVHDPVFPDATGLPAVLLLAVYGIAAAAWAWSNRAALADTDLGVLAVAVVFFALWIAVKVGPGIPGKIPIASGAKLAGIAGWATYLTRTAWRAGRARRSASTTNSSS